MNLSHLLGAFLVSLVGAYLTHLAATRTWTYRVYIFWTRQGTIGIWLYWAIVSSAIAIALVGQDLAWTWAGRLGVVLGLVSHMIFVVFNEDLFDATYRLQRARQSLTALRSRPTAPARAAALEVPPRIKLRVFVSYRRSDARDIVERLYDRLRSAFDEQHLFKDVDVIPSGVDFRAFIKQAINASDVILVVVGPRWRETGHNSRSRLDDEADPIRIELLSALAASKPIIPVLVGGASMPKETELPKDIGEFAYRNAFQLRNDPDFDRDSAKLIEVLIRRPWAQLSART